VRTLVGGGAEAVGAISREWSLVEDEANLLVSVGGKLTSARLEAAQLVDRLLQMLGRSPQPTTTNRRRLPWAPAGAWPAWQQRAIQQGCALGLDHVTARTATHRYGHRITLLWKLLQSEPRLARRLDQRYPFCEAEITIARNQEMAINIDDVFRRRIPLFALGGNRDYLQDVFAGKA
jgi:glycerol-3-phosphate dehydrogenase